MKACKKCGNSVPKFIWVNEKKKNLQSRKFCLECSPYGAHNTRDLVGENKKAIYHTFCSNCNVKFNSPQKKRAQCFSCYFNRKQEVRKENVKEIVGCKCWFCGYSKTWRNLAFHHVCPEDKIMQLSTRELTGYSWKKVLEEMKKCVLCCHNCHGEIHEGIIENSEVLEKFKFWKRSSVGKSRRLKLE